MKRRIKQNYLSPTKWKVSDLKYGMKKPEPWGSLFKKFLIRRLLWYKPFIYDFIFMIISETSYRMRYKNNLRNFTDKTNVRRK